MIDNFPLLRDLSYCRSKDFAEAAKELFITLASTTVPVWLGLLFVWVSPKAHAASYLYKFIISGELLLISAALIGPVYYIITKRYGDDLPKLYSRHFYQGWLFIICSVIVSSIAAAIFGYNRVVSSYPEGTESSLDFGPMLVLSIVAFVSAMVILFFVLAIENFMVDGSPEVMRSDERSYVKRFQRRR